VVVLLPVLVARLRLVLLPAVVLPLVDVAHLAVVRRLVLNKEEMKLDAQVAPTHLLKICTFTPLKI
jgi:hypothetical protein